MMALSGVRSSWLILARKLDFAWLASSARVFSSEYFSREVGELFGLMLERALRGAQVGDRLDQPLLGLSSASLRAA